MKDKAKTFISVNIVFEVDRDKEAKAVAKILQIISKELNCSAVRIEPYEDRKYRKVLIEAEFCRVIE